MRACSRGSSLRWEEGLGFRTLEKSSLIPSPSLPAFAHFLFTLTHSELLCSSCHFVLSLPPSSPISTPPSANSAQPEPRLGAAGSYAVTVAWSPVVAEAEARGSWTCEASSSRGIAHPWHGWVSIPEAGRRRCATCSAATRPPRVITPTMQRASQALTRQLRGRPRRQQPEGRSPRLAASLIYL